MKRLLPFVPLLLVTSCTGVVVKKAELQSIRAAAVVSWFAAQRMPEVRGNGVFRKADGELRIQIAEDGLAAYLAALESLGWEIAPQEEIVHKELYQNTFRYLASTPNPGQSASAFRRHFFSPADMYPIWLDPDGSVPKKPARKLVKSDKEALATILHQARLDAAVLFKLQYCFRTFERDDREQVLATATSAIQIVDRHGKLIYETEMPEGCGGALRGESRASMDIEGEDWIYDPMKREAIRKLFREASQAEAYRLIDSLPVTPKPKEHR